MEARIVLRKWKMAEVEGARKICGEYSVMVGGAELAKTPFNDGYNCVKLQFPTELQLEVEKLTEKIEGFITKNFTGKQD